MESVSNTLVELQSRVKEDHMKKRYFVSPWCDRVRNHIADYATPDVLLLLSSLNKYWYTSANDDRIWAKLSRDLYIYESNEKEKEKEVNQPKKMKWNSPHPADGNSANLLYDRISLLSMSELRKALTSTCYGTGAVDITRCIEKKDYRYMLMAKLVFRNKPQVIAILQNNINTTVNKTNRFLYYPDWVLKLPLGKATYYHSRYDINRWNITKKELCSIKWTFQFKDSMYTSSGQQPPPPELRRNFICQFNEDWSFYSDMHENNNNNDGHHMTYTINNHMPILTANNVIDEYNGNKKKTKPSLSIQVESYPPLIASRLVDGRWSMQNINCIFMQSVEPEKVFSIV